MANLQPTIRASIGIGNIGNIGDIGGLPSGGGVTKVIHSSRIVDPMPRLTPTPGTVIAGPHVHLGVLKVITGGLLTIGGVSTAPINFSAATSFYSAVNTLNNQLAAVDALKSYYIRIEEDKFVLRNPLGNVG